ncbi:MAG TPA: HD domain-containing protein [Candidatus Acidoferrum sp.]|nr:HD domain-containing protein [Candidatus Acidoferrum sp.]
MAEISTRVEPRTDSDLATTALRFARRAHLGQHRKQTHEQFVEHPIAVANLISEEGLNGSILAAAYLHDVVEKTEVEPSEIRKRFGPDVAEVVESLTDDDSVDGYVERKRALRRQVIGSGRDSVLIYAADRVANMRDWRKVAPENREEIGARLGTTLEERMDLWSKDLEDLSEHDPDLPFLTEMEIELRALRADAASNSR